MSSCLRTVIRFNAQTINPAGTSIVNRDMYSILHCVIIIMQIVMIGYTSKGPSIIVNI